MFFVYLLISETKLYEIIFIVIVCEALWYFCCSSVLYYFKKKSWSQSLKHFTTNRLKHTTLDFLESAEFGLLRARLCSSVNFQWNRKQMIIENRAYFRKQSLFWLHFLIHYKLYIVRFTCSLLKVGVFCCAYSRAGIEWNYSAVGSELPTLAEISQPRHISIACLRTELTYMDFKVISIILKEGGTWKLLLQKFFLTF